MNASSSQQVTDELRRWIVEQAQAGREAQDTLRAMLASGWQEDVAIDAMARTLREHLEAKATAEGLPPSCQVPEPDVDDSPQSVDAGDRHVSVLLNMYQPRIVVFGDFLSREECDALIDLAQPRLARSLTVDTKTGGEEINADRTSSGMFFQRGENNLVRLIEARIGALLGWPVEMGEGIQVLRYVPGAEYKPHYDYFDPQEPGTPTIVKRGGQRVATFVMYLREPLRGGGTVFPDVHLEVSPKRGHAVFFSYERPHPSTRTLHGGSPVTAGEKWVATKWLRERRFD